MPVPQTDRSSSLILIVDDQAGNLSVLHDTLDESGFSVLVALNGQAALERARQHLPDIILLDDEMPAMNGLEVLHHLKSDPATCLIPVVFMSNGSDAVAAKAFRSGAIDCISRPIHTSELISRLLRHLKTASQSPHARSALDAFGHASLSVNPETGRISWQTQLARDLLDRHFNIRVELVPPIVRNWLRSTITCLHKNPTLQLQPLKVVHAGSWVIFTLGKQSSEREWLLMLHEESDEARITALLACFELSRIQAEILHWSIKGKHRAEISEIIETPPEQVDQALAELLVQLGVSDLSQALRLAQEKLKPQGPK